MGELLGGRNDAIGAENGAATVEEIDEIVQRFHRLARHAFVGARADVGGDEDFRVAQHRIIGGRRLLLHHVGGIAGEFAGIQCCEDGRGIGELAAAGVDDHGILRQQREALGIDEVFRVSGEFRVWADDVAGGENRVDRIMADDAVLLAELFRPEIPVAVHFHAEGLGADDHFLADATETDDADFFCPQLVTCQAQPFALARGIHTGDEIFHQCEQQAEGVFGHGGVVDARREHDGDAFLLGGGEVDLVETDAILGNDFQAWAALVQHGAGDGIVATEKGIEVARQLQHACLAERPALAHDLIALAGKKLVVRPRGVLETASGQQYARAHKLYDKC